MTSTTPKPELNVEAELESCYVALWENIDDSATARRLELKFKRAVQQDGDQKVRGFSEQVKERLELQKFHDDASTSMNVLGTSIELAIDQTLANYLSHKEDK